MFSLCPPLRGGRGYAIPGLWGGGGTPGLWLGGNPFQVWVEGYPIPSLGVGYPVPDLGGGYPIPGLGVGYPIPGLNRRVSHPRFGQGYPIPGLDRGVPWEPPVQVWIVGGTQCTPWPGLDGEGVPRVHPPSAGQVWMVGRVLGVPATH